MKRRRKKKRGYILPGLGYSPAQRTAPGSGTHGGTPRQKRRRERARVRKDLRDWS